MVVIEISQNLLNGQNTSQKHWSCEATVSLAETMSAVPGPQDDFMLVGPTFSFCWSHLLEIHG